MIFSVPFNNFCSPLCKYNLYLLHIVLHSKFSFIDSFGRSIYVYIHLYLLFKHYTYNYYTRILTHSLTHLCTFPHYIQQHNSSRSSTYVYLLQHFFSFLFFLLFFLLTLKYGCCLILRFIISPHSSMQ